MFHQHRLQYWLGALWIKFLITTSLYKYSVSINNFAQFFYIKHWLVVESIWHVITINIIQSSFITTYSLINKYSSITRCCYAFVAYACNAISGRIWSFSPLFTNKKKCKFNFTHWWKLMKAETWNLDIIDISLLIEKNWCE